MRLHVKVPLVALALFLAGAIWVLAKDVSLGPPFESGTGSPVLAGPELGLGSATLRGRILGADGEPLAEASLFATVRGRPLWTVTAANGEFQLHGVDPGELDLSVLGRGYQALQTQVFVDGSSIDLQLTAKPLVAPILADPTQADLLGAVELSLGRTDPEGYEVYLEPMNAPDELGGPIPRRAQVDDDGSFQVPDLIHGSYHLRLLPPYAAGGSWPDLLTGLDEPPLEFEHNRPLAGLRLLSRAGELAGTALSRPSPNEDARPIEGALLRAEPTTSQNPEEHNPSILPAVTSNVQGHWLLRDLAPGRYRIYLTAGGENRETVVTIPPGTRVDPGL